mgnify:CR=1 FL=1
MRELTELKLEQSQKAVVDTKAAYGAPYTTSYDTGIALVQFAATLDADCIDSLFDAAYAAEAAWVKAKLELEDYLKEQQDNA